MRFYPTMAVVFFVGVLWGFDGTFFFRTWTEAPERDIEMRHVWHGASATLWFLLYLTQSLIAPTRRGLHRLLGTMGLALAVAIPVIGSMMMGAVFLGGFETFGALVIAGIYNRKNRLVHTHLLYLATMVLSMAGWQRGFRFDTPLNGPDITMNVLIPLFIGILAVYDLVTTRRLHWVTWGVAPVVWGWLYVQLRVL